MFHLPFTSNNKGCALERVPTRLGGGRPMSIRHRQRRGNVLVLTLFMMVAIFALLACAIDLGYIEVVQTELQRTADSAATAAAWELIDEDALCGYGDTWLTEQNARNTAAEYAILNTVLGQSMGLAQEDIAVGYLANPSDPASPMCFDGMHPANAVWVRVRKATDQNGEVPLFFARVLGTNQAACQAEATAAILTNIRGFRPPSNGENLEMLPMALDQDTWNALLAGCGTDDWTWNAELGEVQSGPDGILEANLFPQGTGSPGNRGTVDIGSSNNSTADVARQILHGVTAEDLAHHDGALQLDENDQLLLNGDTGISAGVKDELETTKGKSCIIPIFNQVTGPGNNAQYTIVEFAGVRIMEVKLSGKLNSKRVIVQPANVITCGGIPGGDNQTSSFVYSSVWLVR